MASWRNEYLAALEERDIKERESYARMSDDFIDAFTELLDRTSALEAEKAALQPSTPPTDPSPSTKPTKPKSTTNNNTPPTTPPSDPLLLSNLATAHRQLTSLQSRLRTAESSLSALSTAHTSASSRLKHLEKTNAELTRKVRDRDEELKGKDKLVAAIQDEMISLELQLNVSEREKERLKGENGDLVARWMERMGREAEAMNERNGKLG